jgi:hypothetical protein
MSLRALKGRGNLNLLLRDSTTCSEQSEGIFFAPRDDTGIIVFVLNTRFLLEKVSFFLNVQA